ncbi:MAG: hypothetical protein WB919_03315, partial [Candidatus Sulfotelmatobacter sp.]
EYVSQGTEDLSPGGATDNSPALQRREKQERRASPEGRLNFSYEFVNTPTNHFDGRLLAAAVMEQKAWTQPPPTQA